ncbi:predicted protein [Naegleria gruberi]|uniref:Predicted protein n=1 Tax=Naegleria gruberi TaxID=5762 RepID=D2VRC0_NAEGR|nr:uncharacterized protein NAEGRDRAFT_71532 [Naegleria gruberi]EFC40644.1 predicted protein [Naegleria gruberi]|eukprot:XP_002673388.1 predicted protein [Naegleria gruberi strain NEG-M]
MENFTKKILMKSFLRSCKDLVTNKTFNGGTLAICLGNQASDLDSIVSSIVFSYAQYKRDKITSIPIINIPADEYNLRTDATWFLEKFGISGEDLIFYHQNPTLIDVLESLGKENNLQVILTDHNKLTPEQEPLLGNFVYQIIDHHVDEKCYDIPSERRIIDLIGSSCTLVAELLSDDMLREDRECCEALLGTILLDTMNLEPKFKKVTPRDEKQALRLLALLSFEQKQREELFEKLFFERFKFPS